MTSNVSEIKHTVPEFKDLIVSPLRKTIEQYKSATLAQFKTLDDLKAFYARAEGLEIALNHVEGCYASLLNSKNIVQENPQEVLPPA